MLISYTTPARPARQHGLTLIELMVGITIGLMVVLVTMGGMMVSRQVSGAVSDVSNLQQQAAYAFRVLGEQIRSAGGLHLEFAPDGNKVWLRHDRDYNIRTDHLAGQDNPGGTGYKLRVAHINYEEQAHVVDAASGPGVASRHLMRDCLGQQPAAGSGVLKSAFRLQGGELLCQGSRGGEAQPVIGNVADFQVRYLVQGRDLSQLGYAYASNVADWTRVVAVEVCLVLYGTERVDFPAGKEIYIGCPAGIEDPAPGLSMTDAALPAARKNRLHMAFRNVYQLRSHGIQCVQNSSACNG